MVTQRCVQAISHFRMQTVQGWSELLKVLKYLRKFSKCLINKGSRQVISEKETLYQHDGYVHQHTHYLDAVLKQESWHREALFFIKWFTENDDLLKEENPPLFTPRQKSRILVSDQECVLQEQLALGNNFTLKGGQRKRREHFTLVKISVLCFFFPLVPTECVFLLLIYRA